MKVAEYTVRAPVIWPEMLASSNGAHGQQHGFAGQDGSKTAGESHSSGLFCVSMMAAMGIPKLETGPQKSGPGSLAAAWPSRRLRVAETYEWNRHS